MRDEYYQKYEDTKVNIKNFMDDLFEFYNLNNSVLSQKIDLPRDTIRTFRGLDDKQFLFKAIVMFSDKIDVSVHDITHYDHHKDFKRLIKSNQRMQELFSYRSK